MSKWIKKAEGDDVEYEFSSEDKVKLTEHVKKVKSIASRLQSAIGDTQELVDEAAVDQLRSNFNEIGNLANEFYNLCGEVTWDDSEVMDILWKKEYAGW